MNGRENNGQFTKGNQAAKGNKGGPGRPPRVKEPRFYELMGQVVTDADLRNIIGQAVKDAIEGDNQARKFIADYIAGPPIQRSEIANAPGETFTIVVDR